MGGKERFERAQRAELDCWKSISNKLVDPRYIDLKRKLWRDIAHLANLHAVVKKIVETSPKTQLRIADIGCGPSGILITLPELFEEWFPQLSFQFLGFDPLINEYLKISPYLVELPVEWRAVRGEDLIREQVGEIDIVLSFNAIDHVLDLNGFVENLFGLMGSPSQALISVNCHTNRLIAAIFSILQVEKLHPYQLTSEQYAELFTANGGIIDDVIVLDGIFADFDESVSKTPNYDPADGISTYRAIAELILAKIGIPFRGESPDDRSIFKHQLFIVR